MSTLRSLSLAILWLTEPVLAHAYGPPGYDPPGYGSPVYGPPPGYGRLGYGPVYTAQSAGRIRPSCKRFR